MQRGLAPRRLRSVDTVRKARRGAAAPPAIASAALAIASVALTAGCATGTPAPRSATVHPATVHPVAATSSQAAATARTVPPVFAASFGPVEAGRGGDRLALLSSRTGKLLRWLTPASDRTSDQALSMRGGWVYFVRDPIALEPGPRTREPSTRGPGTPGPAIWRVRVTGGPPQLVQAGASDYAVSPDGRAVAYVTSTDRTVEIVARNLATGQRNTIVLATRPAPRANNWPPEASGLTWSGDDAHLAVQFQLTAAIGSVLTFGAFTAATISDGRTGPPPCPAATHDQCAESDPAYLAGGTHATRGTLSYIIQRRSGSGTTQASGTTGASGTTRTSLVTWQAGHPATTMLSFPVSAQPQSYAMTASGQAIWASGPARPKGQWTIWRWSGGAPVKITALPALGASPFYGVDAITW